MAGSRCIGGAALPRLRRHCHFGAGAGVLPAPSPVSSALAEPRGGEKANGEALPASIAEQLARWEATLRSRTSDRPKTGPHEAPIPSWTSPDVSGARATDPEHDSAPDASAWGRYGILERETGFEPATLTLAKGKKRKE